MKSIYKKVQKKPFYIYIFLSKKKPEERQYVRKRYIHLHEGEKQKLVESSSAAGRTENGLPTPSLGMDAPITGVSMGWVSHSQCILQLVMT